MGCGALFLEKAVQFSPGIGQMDGLANGRVVAAASPSRHNAPPPLTVVKDCHVPQQPSELSRRTDPNFTYILFVADLDGI